MTHPTPPIAEVSHADEADWRAVHDACPQATFFTSPCWARIWRDHFAGTTRLRPLALRFISGRLALLPLTVYTDHRGRTHTLSSPGGTYGGILAAEPLTAAEEQAARATLLDQPGLTHRDNPFTASLQPAPHPESDGPTPKPSEAQPPSADPPEPDTTFAFDLAAGIEHWDRIWRRSTVARNARKAARAGISVAPATDPAHWDAYFRLYEASLERWGESATSRYNPAFFELLQHAARCDLHEAIGRDADPTVTPGPRIALWLAHRRGRAVAGAVCFTHGPHRVYWHGAADAQAFADRPVELLITEIARDAAQSGCRWFDLNPSGGHQGVERFKRGLGATAYPAPVRRTPPRPAEERPPASPTPGPLAKERHCA